MTHPIDLEVLILRRTGTQRSIQNHVAGKSVHANARSNLMMGEATVVMEAAEVESLLKSFNLLPCASVNAAPRSWTGITAVLAGLR